MAGEKLSEQDEETNLASTDWMYVVLDPGGTPESASAELGTAAEAGLSGTGLTDVGTPAATDRILLQDASASGALKTADFSEFGGGGGGSVIGPDDLDSFNDAYGTGITSYDEEFDTVSGTAPSPWGLYNGVAGFTYGERLGAGVLHMPTSTGTWRGIERTMPTESTWTATAKITVSRTNDPASGGYAGMAIIENGSLELIPVGWYMQRGNAADNRVYIDRWTNGSTYGSAITFANNSAPPAYYRIRRNSATSFDFECSADGVSWMTVQAAYDVSAFMTPDRIAIVGQFRNDEMAVHWFRVR